MKKLLILPLCLLAVLLDAADRKVNAALIALNKQAEMFCDLLLGVYGETLPVTFLERTSRTALEQEFRLNQTGFPASGSRRKGIWKKRKSFLLRNPGKKRRGF